MKLGIYLSIGDSFKDMKRRGQDSQFKEFYLKRLAQSFDQITVFSYEDEKVNGLPKNIKLIPNKYNLHRYLYAILLPLINSSEVKQCDVFRVYHLIGTPPAMLTKLIFQKPFVFNFAYDYIKISLIEKKFFQILLIAAIKPLAFFLADKIFITEDRKLKKKEVYLTNGVDTAVYKPNPKVKKSSTALSVGRLEKQKNFENLIKAMKSLNMPLMIIGDGSLKFKLKKTAIKEKVNLKIFSKVDNTKMTLFYNKAEIFVLPSLIEGHPKALLEAMSCGLPVIATSVPGSRSIIKNNETGILVDTSAESLKKGITELITDNKKMRRLAIKTRKFIVENFSLERLMEKEINEIKTLKP